MNRKVALFGVALSIVLMIFALIMNINAYRDPSISDLAISDESWNAIISTHTKQSHLNPGSISLNGAALQIDEVNSRLFYSIDPDSAFPGNPKVKLSNDKLKLAIGANELEAEFVRSNQTVKILVYDERHYREFDLVLTYLPVLSISTMDDSKISDEDSDAFISLNNHGSIITSNTKIHLRGGYTKNLEKSSYKLSLKKNNAKKNKISLLGMRSDDDWILNALYTDPEKVREIFATQLWKECCEEHNAAQVPNSFEYRFVELFLNDSYNGLYLLGYKPDKKSLGIKEGEIIFKNQNYFEINNLYNDDYYHFYTIENDVADELSARKELINFLNIIKSGNTDEIMDKFDIPNAIDLELHTVFTAHGDLSSEGQTKNLFLTIKQLNNRRFAIYTPWDFDFCFNNLVETYENKEHLKDYIDYYGFIPQTLALPVSALRKNGDKNIDSMVAQRYGELRQGAWSNKRIMELIDLYEADIFNSGAYLREMNRWPNSNYLLDTTNLDLFREYMTKRLEYLDKYYDFLPE